MNWEFGIKNSILNGNMINVCVEKQNHYFDHADIYGITPPKHL
jgi:predicted oxidoreductase